jgi:hypothetical protein
MRVRRRFFLRKKNAPVNVPIRQSKEMADRLAVAGVPHELVTWPDRCDDVAFSMQFAPQIGRCYIVNVTKRRSDFVELLVGNAVALEIYFPFAHRRPDF